MIIETKRCMIRPFKEEDLEAFVSYRNDEAWMKYQDFKGHTKDEYRKMIIDEHLDLKNGIQLAIIDKVSKVLLGDLYVHLEEALWLGYTIHPSYARKGYAYEAVIGLFSYLKSKGVYHIKVSAHPKNKASLNLIHKLGFKYVGIADNHDEMFELNLEES